MSAGHSELIVRDRFDCSVQHVAEVCWHFPPEIDVEICDDHVQLRRDGVQVRMHNEQAAAVNLLRGSRPPAGGWISRRFGSKQESSSLIVESKFDNRCVLETRFSWQIS